MAAHLSHTHTHTHTYPHTPGARAHPHAALHAHLQDTRTPPAPYHRGSARAGAPRCAPPAAPRGGPAPPYRRPVPRCQPWRAGPCGSAAAGRARPADAYGTPTKKSHRVLFGLHCREAAAATPARGLLYLESPDGCATDTFLAMGFAADQLHPCNWDDACLQTMRATKAWAAAKGGGGGAVHLEGGDICDVYREGGPWLGVWFDMEETWVHTHRPGQPWNTDRVPAFGNAAVAAVTLATHGVHGGAEAAARDLANLLQDSGARMQQLPVAYDGKGGRMNMVFGVATFGGPRTPPPPLAGCYPAQAPTDHAHQRLHIPVRALGAFPGRDAYAVAAGHFVATTVVRKGRIYAVYMRSDGICFANADTSRALTPAEVAKWRVLGGGGAASGRPPLPTTAPGCQRTTPTSGSIPAQALGGGPRPGRLHGGGGPLWPPSCARGASTPSTCAATAAANADTSRALTPAEVANGASSDAVAGPSRPPQAVGDMGGRGGAGAAVVFSQGRRVLHRQRAVV